MVSDSMCYWDAPGDGNSALIYNLIQIKLQLNTSQNKLSKLVQQTQ